MGGGGGGSTAATMAGAFGDRSSAQPPGGGAKFTAERAVKLGVMLEAMGGGPGSDRMRYSGQTMQRQHRLTGLA